MFSYRNFWICARKMCCMDWTYLNNPLIGTQKLPSVLYYSYIMGSEITRNLFFQITQEGQGIGTTRGNCDLHGDINSIKKLKWKLSLCKRPYFQWLFYWFIYIMKLYTWSYKNCFSFHHCLMFICSSPIWFLIKMYLRFYLCTDKCTNILKIKFGSKIVISFL